MRIGEVPAVDVRGSLMAQRGRRLSLLASLSDAQWAAPTAIPAPSGHEESSAGWPSVISGGSTARGH